MDCYFFFFFWKIVFFFEQTELYRLAGLIRAVCLYSSCCFEKKKIRFSENNLGMKKERKLTTKISNALPFATFSGVFLPTAGSAPC